MWDAIANNFACSSFCSTSNVNKFHQKNVKVWTHMFNHYQQEQVAICINEVYIFVRNCSMKIHFIRRRPSIWSGCFLNFVCSCCCYLIFVCVNHWIFLDNLFVGNIEFLFCGFFFSDFFWTNAPIEFPLLYADENSNFYIVNKIHQIWIIYGINFVMNEFVS